MNGSAKKLTLKKETLRELSQSEAIKVQGGFATLITVILDGGGSSGNGGGSCTAGTCTEATCGGTGTCTIACR